MTPLTDNAWEALAQAELATAEEPASAENFRRVASAYEQGGFPDVALAILRKTASFGIEQNTMLPALLSGYRKQRQFAELNTAVNAGLAIGERDAGLRRELALALSSLGQAEAAGKEWASLIRHECMSETDWLGCARSMATCAEAPAFEQMMMAMAERPEPGSSHLAGYCAVKHLVDRDLAAAQGILHKVDPAAISDADVQLDLAILAFRLRDCVKAETAATLAATSAENPAFARNILSSIRSFAGDPSRLRKVSMPIPREAEVRLSALALTVKRDAAAWGFLRRQGPGSFEARLLELTAEPDMTVPEDVDPVVTFSILSENLNPDLFHILCGVDWSWPHCVLQRKPDVDALHVFVEAHGHKYWPWEEVRPELDAATDDRAGAPRRQQSTAWVEALRELRDETEDEPEGMK